MLARLRKAAGILAFRDSGSYWEKRYRAGGTSGPGSYGEHARYKADFLNRFVSEREVATVVEFGCGDGNQLALADYPSYLGLDVARTAVSSCVERFAADRTKSFMVYDPAAFCDPAGFVRADLALSLDVLYHLVEEDTFKLYLRHLFGAARRLVVIYATDEDRRVPGARHVKHRRFTQHVAEHLGWRVTEKIERQASAYEDFFVFEPF